MRIFGTILPYIGCCIAPCDADGIPAFTPDEEAAAHFETECICVAWLGFAGLFPYGAVAGRALDPSNPRQYAPGNF